MKKQKDNYSAFQTVVEKTKEADLNTLLRLQAENSKLKERLEKLVNAFNDFECAGPEQEQENTWEILRELMHQEMGLKK